MKNSIKKAVLPVAGLGTRFLPATKSIPKEIMTLVDRPLIQYSIDEAREAGIEEFIFVTSKGKTALEDYFDRAPLLEATLNARNNQQKLAALESTLMESGRIAYIRQNDPLGLGHAINCASTLIGNEPFAVILTDDIIISKVAALGQMIEAYNNVGGIMVALAEVSNERLSSYGLVEISKPNGRLVPVHGMVEKPSIDNAPSNLAIVGRYILTPDIFDILKRIPKGSGGEIQLTDAISEYARKNGGVNGYCFEGEWFDCGSISGYLQATVSIALKHDEFGSEFHQYLSKKFT